MLYRYSSSCAGLRAHSAAQPLRGNAANRLLSNIPNSTKFRERDQNRRGRWSKSVWRNRSTCFAGTKRAAGRVLVFFKTSFVFDPLGPHYQTRFLLHKLIARRDAKTDFSAGYLNWKHVTKTQTKCIGLCCKWTSICFDWREMYVSLLISKW